MTAQNIPFFESFDLHDRSIEHIDISKGKITFVFNMFHCDDPRRNDEGKQYLLHATWVADAVIVKEGVLPEDVTGFEAEILQLQPMDEGILMGVSWRDYVSQIVTWTPLLFTQGPLSFKEEIKEAGQT